MSNTLVSLLLGIGLAGWVYSKMYRKTGGNSQQAITIAGAAGLISFFIMLIILSKIT